MRTIAASTTLLFVLVTAACGGARAPAVKAPSTAPVGVFSTAAYVATGPAKNATAAHAAKGLPSPTGTACLGCHATGGKAPAFAFAGTVYVDDARSAPNGGAEIAVDDAGGKEAIAHADADGNFWVAGAAISLPAHAGARQGAKIVRMGSVVDKADCNGCHDAKFPIALTPPKG
jgi:cytochrome c553